MLWVLNQSDGTNTLLDVGARSGIPYATLRRCAERLLDANLLSFERYVV